MRSKIALAVIGMGFGLGMSSTVFASNECRVASSNANYYCNVVMDDALCSHWIQVMRGCRLVIDV